MLQVMFMLVIVFLPTNSIYTMLAPRSFIVVVLVVRQQQLAYILDVLAVWS